MIRPATPADTESLLHVAVATGLFEPADAAALLGQVLADLHAGHLAAGHAVAMWVASAASAPEGWVYFAPDVYAEQVWDLWWIGVTPAAHGRGIGAALLESVEAAVTAARGRLLVIETSALDPLIRARAFYRRHGYDECGRIPDFYAAGDDKVIFAKRLDLPTHDAAR